MPSILNCRAMYLPTHHYFNIILVYFIHYFHRVKYYHNFIQNPHSHSFVNINVKTNNTNAWDFRMDDLLANNSPKPLFPLIQTHMVGSLSKIDLSATICITVQHNILSIQVYCIMYILHWCSRSRMRIYP